MTAAVACLACNYAHTDLEPCLFDGCSCCGGTYSFGPSTSSLCWICAEGEQLAVEEPAAAPMSLPAVDRPDEEPF